MSKKEVETVENTEMVVSNLTPQEIVNSGNDYSYTSGFVFHKTCV